MQQSTSQLVGAAVRGAMEGAGSGGSGNTVERVLAALSSERGTTLLTLAISVACRTSTDVLCRHLLQAQDASTSAGQPDLLDRLLQFAGEHCFPISGM